MKYFVCTPVPVNEKDRLWELSQIGYLLRKKGIDCIGTVELKDKDHKISPEFIKRCIKELLDCDHFIEDADDKTELTARLREIADLLGMTILSYQYGNVTIIRRNEQGERSIAYARLGEQQ